MTQEQIERLRSGAENHLAMLPSSSLAPDILTLLARHDRYEKALRDVHEGAARQLAEPRNHDNDQYALTAIATRVEEALRCE